MDFFLTPCLFGPEYRIIISPRLTCIYLVNFLYIGVIWDNIRFRNEPCAISTLFQWRSREELHNESTEDDRILPKRGIFIKIIDSIHAQDTCEYAAEQIIKSDGN